MKPIFFFVCIDLLNVSVLTAIKVKALVKVVRDSFSIVLYLGALSEVRDLV